MDLQRIIAKINWSLLFSKKSPPKVGSISLGDSEGVPLKLSSREDGFDFSQHVAEDQRQLGQVPPVERRTTKTLNSWSTIIATNI